MVITVYLVTSIIGAPFRRGSYPGGMKIRSAHAAKAINANEHAAPAVRHALAGGIRGDSASSYEYDAATRTPPATAVQPNVFAKPARCSASSASVYAMRRPIAASRVSTWRLSKSVGWHRASRSRASRAPSGQHQVASLAARNLWRKRQ